MTEVENLFADVETRASTYLGQNLSSETVDSKMYKRMVEYQIIPMRGSSYSAIRSKVIIHAPLSTVMQTYIDQFSDINAKISAKELVAVQTSQTLVFKSARDRELYKAVYSVQYRIHMFNQSPAPLLTPHREFFIDAKLTKSYNGYKISQAQTKRFQQLTERSIEGSYRCGCIEFVAISEIATEIRYFVHAEPGGSVPAQLYNAVLDRGNELLVLLKRESEKHFDASAANSFDSQ